MTLADRIKRLRPEQIEWLSAEVERLSSSGSDQEAGLEAELVACLVGRDEQRPSDQEMREWIKKRLPTFMVPSRVEWYDSFPQMPNGKIDRKALAAGPVRATARTQPASRRASGGSEAGSPDELEAQAARIWKEVLGADRIMLTDNFFEVGGHSLLAIQVLARVKEWLGIEVPLRVMFETPTLADFVRAIEERRSAGGGSFSG